MEVEITSYPILAGFGLVPPSWRELDYVVRDLCHRRILLFTLL